MNLSLIEKKLENQPKYRIKQVHKLIFQDLIEDWDKASVLPLSLREELKKDCPLEIEHKMFDEGNTIKALIELSDGLKIESVLMKHTDNRSTVCVSSQVGCPLACSFCATGTMGLKRNLTVEEIVLQVLLFMRICKVTNIVFMGMGEPFLNYDNVMSAIRILNSPEYFNIGSRKISISTSGIIEGIERFTNEDLQVNLSISLHAPNDELRSKLMPVNKKYPLKDVLRVVDDYILKNKRKVMFEYLMIKGENDSLECAKELAKIMKKSLYMVNLIVYNPTGKFKASDSKTIKKFKDYLEKEGIFTTQRYEFGRGIKAACGQLATKA
ncbi:MAG TPA: 23S rRNA (adenine(2503)-C(2))-methyltransferase RlmN [Candidatus Pacearchaeota archaeon]|nr:23S rRNA (adenine(2503)-C(2))-methyltransferase RlmN [Candidatus Pacearchaeota archaeon]HPR80209.1 23S rRNA (adenine(2503)-C(2))-methyltransferase RlmN [Candidatus Pacearchaeota archaeon]